MPEQARMAEVVILELLKAEKSTVQRGERKRGSGVQKPSGQECQKCQSVQQQMQGRTGPDPNSDFAFLVGLLLYNLKLVQDQCGVRVVSVCNCRNVGGKSHLLWYVRANAKLPFTAITRIFCVIIYIFVYICFCGFSPLFTCDDGSLNQRNAEITHTTVKC